ARRRYRDEALARYFAGSQRIVLDLRSVVLKRPALFAGEPLNAAKLAEAAAAVGHDITWAERRDTDTAVLTETTLTANAAHRLSPIFGGGPVVAYALDDLIGTLAGVDDAGDDELLELEPAGGVVVVPEPLLELEPVVVSVERDGAPGEADGVRSVPGRSPTRSLRDSLQPAIIVAPRATAKTALSNF